MNKSNESGRPVVPQACRARARMPARGLRLRRKLLPMTIALLFAGPLVVANGARAAAVGNATTPTGGVVVGGVGTIAQDGARTLIQQQSAKLALDWQSFNVGRDASVLFQQPSRSAVALNRILDQNPSQIFGRIDSNGQVFLINTHGFIFGATAKLNVGGLLASTLDLTPKDFLANHYNLDAHGASAGIVNHGLIQAASGGSVGLVGGSVNNDGVILAKYGNIQLDGADRAVLDFDGNGLIQIQVTGPLKKRLDDSAAAVTNSGTLKAEGGTVVLQASAAKDLFTNLVNNSGVVDAGGISTAGGVVRLVASGGNTANSGSINVSGVHGGSAQLLSDRDVLLTDRASVDASGVQGGGSIRIGGGVHGGEGLVQAQRTFVAPDASVRADALQSGNGGSVAVWSTGNTVSMGNISARGGALGGNGGFVETSGLQNLTVTNAPDVGAANGIGGTWLIDPDDIAINATGDTKISAASPFEPTGTGAATIGVDTIKTALEGGNVEITTTSAGTGTGNITVNSGFSFDGGTGTTPPTSGTLKLTAANDITFADNQIFAGTGSYALSVDLEAGNGIAFGSGSGISANGGSVTLNAAAAGIALGQIDAADLTATAAGAITQVGALTISGTSSFNAGTNAITLGEANNKLTGAVSLAGSDVALTNAMATDLGTVAASGTLGVTTTGALSQSGAVSASGAATFTQNGTTPAEQDITLGDTANAFGDAVSFAGTINDLVLTNNAGTKLDGVTTGGKLDVTSAGSLTQAAGSTLSAGGTATFTQSGTTVGDQDIVLGNATLGDHVTFAGTIDNLTLTNATAIANLTVPNIAGDLSLAYTSGTLTWPSATIGTIGGGLTLTAGGGITLNGDITTTGGQTYNSAVTLGGNATLEGTDVSLAAGVTGGDFDLTITGNATLGAASGLRALSVSGSSALGGDITTTGTQTYTGATTLGGNVVLGTTDSAISFGSTVDSFGSTARDLTVTAGTGGVTFAGIVGGAHALGVLDVSGSDTATFAAGVQAASVATQAASLAGDVMTSGNQDYSGAVTLGGDVTLTSGTGDVDFGSTVDNAGATKQKLAVNATAGEASFTGVVGGGANGGLASLTTTSETFSAGELNVGDDGLSITTTAGDIGQGGAFKVTGTSMFNAGAHAIDLSNSGNNFGGAVSLSNTGTQNVTLDNGGNALTLGASTLGSGNFSLTGSGTLTLAGTLTTAGGSVSLGTPVTLGADSGIDTTGSSAAGADIGITGAVDGARGLTLTAGTGAISLGAAVGDTTSLTTLTASGGSFTAGTLDLTGNLSITTTAGPIGQSGAFKVGGTSMFNAGANAINLNDAGNQFTGAVSLNNTGNNNVTLNNGTYALTLGTTSIGSGALSLPGSGALTLAGNLTTAGGALSVDGPVAFGSTPVVIDTTGAGTVAGGASINFGGALTGTSDLTLNAGTSGMATLGGAVAMGTLAVTAGGGIALNTNVTTAGKQAYHSAVTLGADVTLDTSSGNGEVAFDSTIGNATAHSLTVTAGSGAVGFGGAIGTGTDPLGALSVTNTGATTFGASVDAASLSAGLTNLGGNVTTSGTQTYGDTAILDGDTTLKGSSVSLAGVAGGGNKLSAIGATTLGGVISGVDVLSITGATTINTANVGTSGNQTYAGAVTLGQDATLASTGGGAVQFTGTVDGAHALTVSTAGTTSFGGAVGSTGAGLSSLTTNAGGGTTLNGDVTTSGAQSYGDALTLGGNTTLKGSAISLPAVTGGSHDLSTSGDTTLGGALVGVGALSIDGAATINTANVDTTGDQTYTGAVLLGADTALTSGGATGIAFTGTIDNATPTARSLDVGATAGGVTFGGAIGAGVNGPLAGLTVASTGNISQAAGSVFKVSGPASFTADAGAGDITLGEAANAFGGAVTLKGHDVTINNAGALELGASTIGGTLGVTAGGSITQATSPAPLQVTGTSTFTVTAADSDVLLGDAGNDLQGAVTVTTSGAGSVRDLSLTNTSSSAGAFTPPATMSGDLTLDYANAALILGTTSLSGALDVTSGPGITLNGSVTTGGDQGYHGAVTLGTNVTLDSSGGNGNVMLDGAVGTDGTARALAVNTGSGTVEFTGAVGTGASPLGAIDITTTGATTFGSTVDAASLTTASGPVSLAGDVTTSGAQGYGGAVTLGAGPTTLTGNGISFGSTLDNAASATPVALTVKSGTGAATFTGAVGSLQGALTGLTVTGNSLTTGSTLDIGSGGLSVTTTGDDITQAALGGYTVTGTSAFDAGAHAISLDAGNNAFGGAVSLNNSGPSDVTLDNGSHALSLGSSMLGSGTLTLKGAGITQVAGSAITQAAGAGATTLDADLANDLILKEAGNDFSGAITATGKAVELSSANALTVASLTNAANSDVSLIAGGQLTLDSAINAIDTGTADLRLESGGTLTLPGALSGHDITLSSGSDLAINNVLTGTGTITLTSTGGNITQNAAIVSTGGALAGTSGGSTTLLDPGNQVANLGKFVTGGDFSFNNAQALTVDKPVLANGGLGNITLTTTGANSDLVLDTQIQGTDVRLGAGGAITQTVNGTIQSSTLTGTSTGDTTLTGPNEVATLNAFTSGGNFSFTNAKTLTVVGPLAASSGSITLQTTGAGSALQLDTGIAATNVELDSGAAIAQQSGTVIQANTLKGAAAGDVTLDGANLIGTLNDFSAANFSLVNAQDLTLAGVLSTTGGTGSISLRTTAGTLNVGSDLSGGTVSLDSAGDLGLAQNVSGTTGVVLKSGGMINQSGGVITAGTLTGSSTGATTLTTANQVTALGDFTAAGFSLVNAQALAIDGTLDGGASVDLQLTAGDLTEGVAGVITAGTLTGQTTGDTTLDGANQIGTLGNFSAANFSLTNAQALTLTGALTTTSGTGNISLKTTAGTLGVNSNLSGGAISLVSATDLALGQTIDGSVSVNLGAGGAITQNAGGTIQTELLTGTSGGDTTLDGNNLVVTLGNFTTGGNFSFNSAQSLTVGNPVSANNGAGNITLTTSGAGSNLELATQLKGTMVTLGATGTITQTPAGTIQAATLTGNSTGDTTLTGPNQVGTLGAFSTGGNFSFANAQTLTVTGPLSAPGGNISLSSAAGGGGDLILNTGIHATMVTLASGGAITQQAGTAIQAGTLTGSASGQVALTGANQIGTLGAFSAAGFSLTNAQGLTVAGPLTTSGDVSLTTTSGVLDVNTDLAGAAISLNSAGDLTLAHAVNGTSINLQSGGNISQAAGGSLTAATLTGKSAGSTVLGGAGGGIGALGDFTANGFSLTNGQTLVVSGVVDGGPSVKLVTTSGDLTLNGTVKGAATTLTSAGAIGEGDAGVLSADTLTGSSAGATTLAGAQNAVGTLDGFTANGFSLTSSRALTVNGPLDGGDSVALTTTTGDLAISGGVTGDTTTLTAAGNISEGAHGTLTATTLSGSSGGDTTLNGANRIATLGKFAAANLSLTNGQALAVAGPVTVPTAGQLNLATTTGALTVNGAMSGGAVTLTSAGDITFNQAVQGTTVALVSGGKITQSDAGILTAGTLTGSSVGATDLDPVNHVDTLGSFSADGFALATDHALTVTGPVAGGPTLLLKTTNGDLAINGAVSGKTMTLISAGALTEASSGSLAADTLTGSSVGATTLDAAANLVGTMKAFTAGSFSLTTGQALTVAEALDGGSALTLTTTKGDLLLDAGLTSTGLTTLNSAGAITAGVGGSITAGTLTGSAVGPTLLGSAATPVENYIGTLGGFVSPAGFSLTNNQTLTLASVNGSAYTVDAGTSNTYLAVLTGDLLQSGSNWLRNGTGTWSSAGAMGDAHAPIYVLGVGAQQLDAVGFPPGYFYALDAQGNLLPLTGAASFNVPTSALTSHAQNSNNHTDAYIDPSIITARYRAFGMVPPGLMLPADQQRCDPNVEDCPGD